MDEFAYEVMMATAKLTIRGRVQGVFYRQSTRDKAIELGLSGWVRNLDNGAVEAEICGPEETVRRMIEWCRQGPPSARVDAVDVEWLDDGVPPPGFQIR